MKPKVGDIYTKKNGMKAVKIIGEHPMMDAIAVVNLDGTGLTWISMIDIVKEFIKETNDERKRI